MSDIKLFRFSSGKTEELSGKSAVIEKTLQNLIESQMEAFLGVRFLAGESRRDLLEIFDDRHGTRATIITSQLPVKHWHEAIVDWDLNDRDNSDSEMKLKLGKLWESKAGVQFKYMMVFENNPIDGAERLSDALKKLGQM